MSQQHKYITTAQPLNSTFESVFKSLKPLFQPDLGGLIILCLVFCFLASFGRKKGKLNFARPAGKRENLAALVTAERQLQKRQHNKVTLYVGTPRSKGLAAKLGIMLGKPPSLYVPNASEGTIICGAPGKGKTFSVIDPLIRSSLDQGFPTVVYDFKGDQIRAHAAYAAARGYNVHIFAPGKPYSDVCNPLDFIRDEGDRSMAKQFAIVLNRNAQSNANATTDEYFSKAGDLLLQGLLLLAKGSCYDDLLMVWSFLSLPKLAQRLDYAQKEGNLAVWASIGARALMSVAHAQETEGGIISNAINAFADLISRDFIPCLCGKTTLPLDVTGKTLIFFQLDQETRDACAPLVATMLHLLVARNMAVKRTEPLVLAMDELPTLYLPDLVKWINEYRSNGLCTILGYQNQAQLEDKYGKEKSQALIAGVAGRFYFNPQHGETAKQTAEYYGEEEVVLNPKSKNHGKNPSTGQSEQYNKRYLFDARFLTTLPPGKCIFSNGAYAGGGEAALPQCVTVKLPKNDLQAQEKSEALWAVKVLPRLVARARQSQSSLNEECLKQELSDRSAIAFASLHLLEDLEAELFSTEDGLFEEDTSPSMTPKSDLFSEEETEIEMTWEEELVNF